MEPGFFLFALFVCAIIMVGVLAFLADRRRTEGMRALASQLGLRYHARSRGIPKQFQFLNRINQGHSRYARNILDGVHRGRQVLIFDYHYTTGSGKNTQHHQFSFFLLRLERSFPQVTVRPEIFLERLGDMLGLGDIDFESIEFSNAFHVQSRDRRLAYDLCHPRMMEFLLKHRKIAFEIENDWLAVAMEKCLSPEEILVRITLPHEIRDLFPEYLFTETNPAGQERT